MMTRAQQLARIYEAIDRQVEAWLLERIEEIHECNEMRMIPKSIDQIGRGGQKGWKKR